MVPVLDVRVLRGYGGGPEKTLSLSANYLERYGYRMICAYLCSTRDDAARCVLARLRQAGVSVYAIDDRGPLDTSVISRLRSLIRQEGINIYHGHDYKSNLLAKLVADKCVPVATLHGWVDYSGRLRYYYALERRFLRQFARVYCVSRELCQQARRAGVSARRIRYLPNGILLEQYRRTRTCLEARKHLGVPLEGFCLGSVARLSSEKNHFAFLETIGSLRRDGYPVWGILVGDGPQRDQLEYYAYRLGVREAVVFTGYQVDVRPWLECMDAYLCTSIREGAPNSVLEAMAMEVPVIARSIGELPYMITHGHEGWLLMNSSVEEITAAVKGMIQGSIDRNLLAQRAKLRLEQEFSFTRRLKLLAADYDKLLSEYSGSKRY